MSNLERAFARGGVAQKGICNQKMCFSWLPLASTGLPFPRRPILQLRWP